MKKYFKLGTALAFSVLLNLSPTVIQNVHAEDANPKEEIVEKVDVNQTNTINDVLNNNSTIEVEEPIVSEKITKESTSATANNVLESAPARAPNTTVEEQNEVNQNEKTDNNIIETDEIKDSDKTSEKKTGKVIVRYIDELGFDIFDAITIDGNVGDSYVTEKKVIDGYTYTSVEGEEKSNITEETTYVIYTYKKSESPVIENIIKNNTKNLTEDNIQKDTKGVLNEEGNEQLGEQNRDSDSSQTPASAAATITDNSFTITATPTKLDTREDTIHYNLNYSFKVTNYNGNLAIRITDTLPYTSGNYKASVTEDTINALNATIGTSYTNYNQLIWENNLGEVNTYDEEGVTFTGEIPFDLAFTGIPYTVNSFTNRITPYVISYYSTDGTTIKEGSKAISSQSSQKSSTFTVPVANEETKSLTVTGPNEINSLDELVTYTINYNFDITNTNASAVLTITDTLPITIDEENENNDLAGGTHTDGSKSIVWKINVPEKERCVDGVCTPENISGSIVFKVAYNLASLNNNLNKNLVNKVKASLSSASSTSSIPDQSVSTKVAIPATINIKYKDIEGNVIEGVEPKTVIGVQGGNFNVANTEYKLDLSNLYYEYKEARKINGESSTLLGNSTKIDLPEIEIDYIYEKYKSVTINYKDVYGETLEGATPVTTYIKKNAYLQLNDYKVDYSANKYYLASMVKDGTALESYISRIQISDNTLLDFLYEIRSDNNNIHVNNYVEAHDGIFSSRDTTYNQDSTISSLYSNVAWGGVSAIDKVIITLDDKTYEAEEALDEDYFDLDFGTYANPKFYFIQADSTNNILSGYLAYNPRFINEYENRTVDFYHVYTDKDKKYKVSLNYYFLDEDSMFLTPYHTFKDDIEDEINMPLVDYMELLSEELINNNQSSDIEKGIQYFENETFEYNAEELVDYRYNYNTIGNYLEDDYWARFSDIGGDEHYILPIQKTIGIDISIAETAYDELGNPRGVKLYGNMIHSDITVHYFFVKQEKVIVNHILLKNGEEELIVPAQSYSLTFDSPTMEYNGRDRSYAAVRVLTDIPESYECVGYKSRYDNYYGTSTEFGALNPPRDMAVFLDYPYYMTFYYNYYYIQNGNLYVHHVDKEGNPIEIDKEGENVVYTLSDRGEVGTSYAESSIYKPIEIAGYLNTATDTTDFSGNKVYTEDDIHIFYIYEPVGKVQVNHLDSETNNPLASQVNKEGVVGDTYTTTQEDIDNYLFDRVEGEPTGQYVDDTYSNPIVVNYYYTVKRGNVLVSYVDEDGNNLKEVETLSGKNGDEYKTYSKDFTGYTIKTIPDNKDGLFEYGVDKEVVYIYSKNTYDFNTEKDKTATELDENEETIIDLIISGKDKNLTSDVVFVLDKSDCNQATIEKANELLDDLYTALAETQATVKVGVITYGGDAKVSYGLTSYTEEEQANIDNAILDKSGLKGGTNIGAGVEKAIDTLTADTEVPNNRKYVILVSDGLTRLFTQNNELKTIYYQLGNYSDRSNYEGGPTGWSLARNGRDGNYNIPDNLTWDEWWQKVNEYVETDQDTFVQSYEPYGVNVPYSRISSEIENGTFVYVPHDDKEHALSFDRSMYEAEKVWKVLVNLGINGFTTSVRNTYGIGEGFLKQLARLAGNDDRLDFMTITDKIINLLGKGSKVIDYIGNSFDVVKDSFEVIKNEEPLEKTVVDENTYTFGTNEDEEFLYKVTYNDEDESFEWLMNENVSSFDSLVLRYKEKLVEKADEMGEYTVPTNEKATLYPVNEEQTGEPEDFPVPTVTYNVIHEGTVIIHYIDKHGNIIYENDTLTGTVGDEYTTATVKAIRDEEIIPQGYRYLTSTGKTEGTFTNERPINVSYIYEKLGLVTIKYIDIDTGDSLVEEDDKIYGTVNESYITSPKEFEDYLLVSNPDNQYGTYSEEDQEVVYKYQKIEGQVIVHYVDLNNNEIAEVEVLTGKVNDIYNTSDKIKDIEGYFYLAPKDSSKVSGSYTKDVIDVYYVYMNGTFTGDNGLKGDIFIRKTGEETFDTENEEVFSNLYENDVIDIGTSLEIGVIKQQLKDTVEAMYKVITGKTELTPFDQMLIPAFTSRIELENVNSSFKTELMIPKGIVVPTTMDAYKLLSLDGNNYEADYNGMFELIPVEVEETDNGTLVKIVMILKDQTSTGDYSSLYDKFNKLQTALNNEPDYLTFIMYGAEIAEGVKNQTMTITGNVIGSMDADAKVASNNRHFSFDWGSTQNHEEPNWDDAKDAIITDENNNDIQLTLEVLDYGQVIIHYEDKNGNVIRDNDSLSGKIGENYNTDEVKETRLEDILSQGYKYLRSVGKTVGTFLNERPINVTYIFEKLGNVIIKYLEEITETPLASDDHLTGTVGESYSTSARNIQYYDLVAEPDNKYGNYTETDQTVIYYYKKHTGRVITHYVDIESNEEIAEREIQMGKVEDNYETTLIEDIENYTYVNSSDNTTGTYKDGEDIDVYYRYQKNSGDVVAIYKDAITNEEIAERYTKHGYVDETYETPQKEIEGYDFVRVDSEEIVTGNFKKDETITVTYYYKAVEEEKIGNVIVKYLDKEDNKPLSDEVSKSGIVGEEYRTDEMIIEGYSLDSIVTTPDNTNNRYTEESINEPIVVIYYYNREGKVITHYVNENGDDLAAPETQTGKIGNSYSTVAKTFNNYELSGIPENQNGNYAKEDTHVIYVYKEKKNNNNCCNNTCCNTCSDTSCNSCSNTCSPYLVITRYEDEAGNTISEEVIEHITENAQYATKKKVIDGYEFVKVSEDSDPTEGTYIVPEEGEAEPIIVTYIYKKLPQEEIPEEPAPNYGILIVHYVDENNNALLDDVVTTAQEGTKYVTSQKVIDGYNFVEKTDNYKGTYNDDIIEVTYKYKRKEIEEVPEPEEPKTGYVVVKYIDDNEKEISEKEILSGKIGDFYFTTQRVIEGYIYVSVDNPEEGEFEEEIKRVTYTYKKIENPTESRTGKVVVRYVDELGQTIEATETITGEVGESYITDRKLIEGYTFKSVEGNEQSNIVENTIYVTYTYEKIEEPVVEEVKNSYVVVKYVEKDTNKVLAENVILTGKVGENYFTSQKTIEGYNYVSTVGDEEGTYSDEIIKVTYEYEKVEEPTVEPEPVKETGILVVHYQDVDGNIILDDVITMEEEGTKYVTSQKAINNYTFVRVEGETTGVYTNDIIEVTYIYQKVEEPVVEPEPIKNTGILVVHYQDVDGNTILDDVITTEEEGTKYVTSQKVISGYTYKSVEGNTIGEYNNDIIEVTYKYSKVEEPTLEIVKTGKVVVRYLNETGQTISESVTIEGKENDPYVTDRKLIEGYTYLSVDGVEQSTIVEGTTYVTYTYTKNPEVVIEKEKVGYVIAKYIDENNSEIATKEIISGKVGDLYFTTQKKIDGYIFVSVDKDDIGLISDGITIITYSYKENVIPTPEEIKNGKVIVRYVDELGQTIESNEIITGEVGESYITDRKLIDGYTYLSVDGEEQSNFTEDTIYITYTYSKNIEEVEETGYVLVHYRDEDGNAISSDLIIVGNVGDTYIAEEKVIDGYTLVDIIDNTAVSPVKLFMLRAVIPPSKPNIGTITSGVKEITFVYKSNKGEEPIPSKVVVHYEDKDGNTLVSDVVIDGYVGDLYTSKKEIIPDYQYVETIGNSNGNMPEGIYEVTYIYELIPETVIEEPRDAYIIISYVDEDNNPILDEVVLTGKDNEKYIVTKKSISGYTYIGVEGEEIGVYTSDEIQRVIYSYKKIIEENNTSDENNCNNCCNNCCNNGCNSESGSSNNNPSININIGDTTINNDNKQGDINISTGDNNNTNTSDSSSEGGNSSSNSNSETGDSTSTSEGGNSSSESTNTNDNQSAGGNSSSENNTEIGDNTNNNSSEGGEGETSTSQAEGGKSSSDSKSENGDITNTSEGGSSSSESSSQGGNSTSEGGTSTSQGGNSTSEGGTSTSQGGNSTSEGGTSTSQGGSSSSESQSSNGDNTNDNVINIGDNTNTSSSEGGNNTSGDSTSTSEGGDAIVGDHTDTNNNSSEGGNASSEGSNENNNQTNGGNSSVGDHTNNNTNTCTDNCNTEEPLPIIRGLVVSYYRDIDGNILADNEIIQNDINSYYATKEKAINNYKLIEIDGNPIGKIGTEPISITYYYQKVDLQESKQGIVVVHYVDENGTAIANDIKLVGRESSSYATSQIIINGYDFVKVIGSPVGEFNDTVIEVTYVYKKISSEETPSINIGTVVVHYIDTDNNVVGGDVILHGLEGLSYVTNEKNIYGYNYIRVEGSKTGVFIDGNIDVTYVYEKDDNESTCTNNCSPTIIVNPASCDSNCNEEKDGVVLVKYLDTKGNVLANDIILKDSVGNIYTTNNRDFDGYSLVSVIGNTSGVYQDGIQNVTYIYEKNSSSVNPPIKYGTVKVSYADLDGNLLSSIIEYKDEVGKDYHTVQYNFAGYQFVRVLGSPDGQFSEGEKSVIYLYKKHEEQVPETEKKYGIVLTKYIDTFGNILCDDIIIRDEVDQDYVTSEKKFDNYNLITVVGNRIGKFIDGVLEVDYIYHKEDECEDKECPKPPVCPDKDDCSNKNGIVLVRYIDNNGNTLSDEITLEGKINEFYVTSQKSFDGYSFVTVTGNRFGKYIDGTLEVTYIYKKTNTTPSEPDKPEVGTVIVKYIDTLGNVLHEDKVLEDEIGKNYQTFPVNIPGYTYRKVLGMPNGKYSLDDQVIIYIYDKITSPRAQGKVIVHYIDENGNKLLDDKVSTGYVDDPYKSIQESISKYDFIKVIGNETGNYQNDDIHITYVYGKKKGKVIAHYVDIYGNMIGYDIIQEGYLDDKYETKLRKFRGYDFVQIVGDLAGQYRTSDIHVTYIYQKREEQVQPIGSPIIIPDETAILSTKRSVSSPSLSIYDPIEIPNTGIDYKKDYFTFFILMICNISIILYLRKKFA